jgi:NDP-sugar pyrophosphorylase family protein
MPIELQQYLNNTWSFRKDVNHDIKTAILAAPWEQRVECGTAELGGCENLQGSISKSGKIVDFREKDPNSPSNLNNASIYMIEKDFLKMLDPMRTQAKLGMKEPFYDFGKHVFPAMLDQLKYISLPKDHILWGLQYDGLWFDVGRKEDYLNVNNALMDGEIEIDLPYESLPWGYLGNEVSIDFSKVDITPPEIIGNGCIIKKGTKIGPYAVIGDGWTIEEASHISKSVLWKTYPYIGKGGKEVPVGERKYVDRHQVCRGTIIQECIIVGGIIQGELQRKTVDVSEDGHIEILPIDWVPEGPRA